MNNLSARTDTNYNNSGSINSNFENDDELSFLLRGNNDFSYKIKNSNTFKNRNRNRNTNRNINRNNVNKKKGILKRNNRTQKKKKEVFFHPILSQSRMIDPEGLSLKVGNRAKTQTKRRLNIPVNFSQEKNYNDKQLIAHLAAEVIGRHNSLQNSLHEIVMSDLDESMKKNLFNFVQRKYKGLVEKSEYE